MNALLGILLLGVAPLPVIVPPALTTTTSQPELSGLVWSGPLQRYLVVTDDSGHSDQGTRHTPVVLGMDAGGVLDPSPIPILGIKKLNDAEAICAGPKGTFFLVTSHSLNKEGESKRPRRQLLHLEQRGRALRVLGNVDLTQIEGGQSLLAIAGLPSSAPLDIEALAFRDGALFVGLKSPLTAGGAATILRLSNAVQVLRSGRVPRGGLTLWAQLTFCVVKDGSRVCQGFSDMLFLADGSLVASANAPKGGPTDGGGAIWWAKPPVGKSTPVLLHRFPGLKPEGVAFSPGGKSLAVVFDTGLTLAPLWAEIPLPGR